MQTFKQWLLTEDIEDDTDAFGQFFMPTTAGDYLYAASDPTEHWWLQWKWAQEREVIHRPFHNIDAKEFEKRDYVAMQSETMPAASGPGWKHKPDVNSKNISVHRHYDLGQRKIAKHGADTNAFLTGNQGLTGYRLPLDQMFGDKPTGKWPEQAEDKRWCRKK